MDNLFPSTDRAGAPRLSSIRFSLDFDPHFPSENLEYHISDGAAQEDDHFLHLHQGAWEDGYCGLQDGSYHSILQSVLHIVHPANSTLTLVETPPSSRGRFEKDASHTYSNISCL